MSTIIQEKNNILLFKKDYLECPIKINCQEKKYENGNIFFYINYECKINNAHPFSNSKNLLNHVYGDIIKKNSLTYEIIKKLMMKQTLPSLENICYSALLSTNFNKTILNQNINKINIMDVFNDNITFKFDIKVTEILIANIKSIYKIDFILSNQTLNSAHPFYNNKFKKFKNGYTIVKDNISEELINYLMIPLDKLSIYSGNVDPNQYYGQLMKMGVLLSLTNSKNYNKTLMKIITLFWD